ASDASGAWQPVQFLSRTTGTLAANDTDLFSYQFSANDLLTINARSTSGADLKVSILNSSGQPLAVDDGTSNIASPGDHDSNLFSFLIPNPGTYYLQIQSSDGSSGDYIADLYLSTNSPPP